MSQQSRESDSEHSVVSNVARGARRQGRYWILTIPFEDWTCPEVCPEDIAYVHGQQEIGESGYHHWQLFVITKKKASLHLIKRVFGLRVHGELTRSDRAEEYCLKEDTAVDGTRFELGTRPLRRNVRTDWERVWELAVLGDIGDISANIRIQHYRSLQQIRADFASPKAIERTIHVYWGRSGSGKSERAWLEAGIDSFSKDPRSKFWYGYRSQKKVVFDEFRGGIDISHILRWFDRYPVSVELKGSSCSLEADEIWITSNLSPDAWYPDLDPETRVALHRRLTNVIHFP